MKKVSIIVPTRNEEEFIGPCLDSLIRNKGLYPEIEIIVVDGHSTDRTREICESYGDEIKCLSNPHRIFPAAVNLGVLYATGEIVMIVGAHAVYQPDYVKICVDILMTSSFHNVGGTINYIPRSPGLIARALTIIKSDKFGVGKSEFRVGVDSAQPVDTVFGGCYWKWLFDRIGPFDERLRFSSDLDFNLRLKKAGYRTVLLPWVKTDYWCRSEFKPFMKKAFEDGQWIIYPWAITGRPLRGRHFVPLAFVSLLPVSIWPYLILNFARCFQIGFGKRDWKTGLALSFLFPAYHVCYGTGSLIALLKAFGGKLGEARSGTCPAR